MIRRLLLPVVLCAATGCAPSETLSVASSGSTSFAPPAATRAARDHRSSITIVTYNVNFGLAGDPSSVEAIATSEADLVLLQETNEDWEEALRAALSDRYPHRRFHHCCRAGGLAILSRFPVHPRRVLHPDVAWFPAWRGDVDSPIGTLQTLNVHLRPNVTDSGSVVLGLLTTPRVRTTEMETYVEALDADLPAIVAGDFNEEAGGGLRVLEARGLRAVAPAGRASTWRWSTSLGEVDASLDHVVVSPELVADEPRVLRSGRSDHFPVAVELRLR